jgi:hypothetical protein
VIGEKWVSLWAPGGTGTYWHLVSESETAACDPKALDNPNHSEVHVAFDRPRNGVCPKCDRIARPDFYAELDK